MKLNKYIDHTNLKPFATKEAITKLCADATKYEFASVCANHCEIALAKEMIKGTDVKVCTVIGFPLGRNLTETKIAETESAYRLGCDEFDMVINVGKLKDGDTDYVKNEIAEIVKAAKGRLVKVIIETGLLTDEEKVTAVKLACEAGANFVKTCSGVSAGVATAEDVALMKANCTAGVKVKASSGIRSYEDAEKLIAAGAERLGTSAGISIIEGAPKE